MFSRIQTIFLFLVALAMFTLLLFPIWTKSDAKGLKTAELNAFSLTYQKPNEKSQTTPSFYIALAAIGAGAVSLYSVIRYRNQMKDTKLALYNQIRFSMMASLLIMITAVLIIFFQQFAVKTASGANNGSFGIGFFCIPVALLCNFLASRFIRRDYNTIKSMDRLR
jgi:uncharacterized membrane protein